MILTEPEHPRGTEARRGSNGGRTTSMPKALCAKTYSQCIFEYFEYSHIYMCINIHMYIYIYIFLNRKERCEVLCCTGCKNICFMHLSPCLSGQKRARPAEAPAPKPRPSSSSRPGPYARPAEASAPPPWHEISDEEESSEFLSQELPTAPKSKSAATAIELNVSLYNFQGVEHLILYCSTSAQAYDIVYQIIQIHIYIYHPFYIESLILYTYMSLMPLRLGMSTTPLFRLRSCLLSSWTCRLRRPCHQCLTYAAVGQPPRPHLGQPHHLLQTHAQQITWAMPRRLHLWCT